MMMGLAGMRRNVRTEAGEVGEVGVKAYEAYKEYEEYRRWRCENVRTCWDRGAGSMAGGFVNSENEFI